MKKRHLRQIVCSILIGAGLVAGCGESSESEETCDASGQWEKGKAAHEKYSDISKAWEDGYRGTNQYWINGTNGRGNLGIYMTHPSHIDTVELEQAAALLYNLDDEGNYELSGVQYFVSEQEVERRGNVPKLLCRKMNGLMPAINPALPNFYQLTPWYYEKSGPEAHLAISYYSPSVEAPSYVREERSSHQRFIRKVRNELRTAEQARAAGYVRAGDCEDGKGIPFVNDAIETVDPTEPHTLFFRPVQGKDQLSVAAARWSVSANDTEKEPRLFEQEFKGPRQNPAGSMEYQLYNWYLVNPNGLFAESHPSLRCSP